MNILVGIDGGGTKTVFCAADQTGRLLGTEILLGCSYRQYSLATIQKRIKEGISACLGTVPVSEVSVIAFGVPCFGENEEKDREIEEMLRVSFPESQIVLVNDVEVAWFASSGGKPSIHVVAGTGSIAYGRNREGKYARSGGWPEFFGDEGSCHWLGRKTMELFSKQIDGRLPKSPLYDLMSDHLKLVRDEDFIFIADELIPYRDKVASLQIILAHAARDGDQYAVTAYHEAIEELVLLISSIQSSLKLDQSFSVFYSGGLFHAGELVLPHLRECVQRMGGSLQSPLLKPMYGGLILAYSALGFNDINSFIDQLTRQTEN